MLSIYSTNEIAYNKEVGSPFPEYEWTVFKIVKMVLFSFGIYWTLSFWNNFCDFVVAGAAVNYYFYEKSVVPPAILAATTFHIGSIALASLILTPVSVVKFLTGWIYDLAQDETPNCTQKIALTICCCLCWPYEKFFLRVNEGAFSMTFLTSLDFCPSSKKVFYLQRRVGKKIGDLDIVGMLYSFAGRLFIAAIPTFVTWKILTNTKTYIEAVNNPFVPTISVFVISVIIATMFLNMFATANEALIICYMIQLDTDANLTHEELA